jgi:cytochrome c2
MDSTEFNKIAGAGLGALLIFLLLNFFSGQIYGTGEVHEEAHVLAYALPVETEGAGEPAEEPAVDLAALVASADPAAGEKVFRACSACHKVEEGANAVGPHLFGVVGRDIASVEGFSYSDALIAAEGEWTLEKMSAFLEDPKAWAPGTKMSFAGLDDPQDRVNVVAYLNQADGSPVDLAAGLEPVAAAGAEAATDAAAAPAAAEGEAAATAPAGAEPGAAETSVSEGDDAGGQVTGKTIVDTTEEGADVPTSPAAETGEAQPTGETVLQTGDPSPEAPAQQDTVGEVGLPGQGAEPQEGAPLPGGAAEAPAAPSSEDVPPGTEPPVTQTPVERRPGEQSQQGQVPQGPAQQPVEPQAEAQQPQPQAEQAQQGQAEPAQEMAAAPAAGAAAAGGLDFAAGDAAAGEKLFRRCAACHKVEEGKHGIGPSLWGVVGRDIAALEDYGYSDAMQAHEGAWTPEVLSAYLENPKAVVPGTKMAFPGLRDAQDRIDVITYLNEADGSPEPLQ